MTDECVKMNGWWLVGVSIFLVSHKIGYEWPECNLAHTEWHRTQRYIWVGVAFFTKIISSRNPQNHMLLVYIQDFPESTVQPLTFYLFKKKKKEHGKGEAI